MSCIGLASIKKKEGLKMFLSQSLLFSSEVTIDINIMLTS